MGKVKEILVELGAGQEAVVTKYGLTVDGTHISIQDLESTMVMIRFLRETRPFETLEEMTRDMFPELPSLLDIPTPTPPHVPIVEKRTLKNSQPVVRKG